MNMMGEDHLVLGRLISTLAVIMHAAANTPVSFLANLLIKRQIILAFDA